MDYFDKIPNLIEAGIIVINSRGYIKIYNDAAKNYFALNPRSGPGHPAGRLIDGDIVVIADNVLGEDDGKLEPSDLRNIGIDPHDIKPGSSILAVGKVGDTGLNGSCRVLPPGHNQSSLALETTLNALMIEAEIDFLNKRMHMKINGWDHSYPYVYAVGHMVAVDGQTHEVKFYQHRGFTSRNEAIKQILRGSPYQGKGDYAKNLDIVGQHILKVHPDSEVVQRLLNTAYGKEENTISLESSINRIPLRCSIKAIDHDNERVGALLELLDISELKAIQKDRERALTDLKKLEEEITKEKLRQEAFQNIFGQGPTMQKVIQTATKMAETDATILLQGESGTGKNLFADAIHKASSRKNCPFIYINCASIPENLLESELFGHKRGSFTGAVAEKKGKFEIADKGTIFLDEINELPLTLQAKLLHVLQNRTFTMVGGNNPIQVDIRIITASNKDLGQLVLEGLFRRDLYYRINVLSLTIPPLRERKEELLQLIGYLTERWEKKNGRSKKTISPEVIKLFFEYQWPGNIRELENLLERAMVMSEDTVYPEHLPDYILAGTEREKRKDSFVFVNRIGPLKDIIEEVERKVIEKALEFSGGNKKKAIDLLQTGKTGFYERLKRFGL